MKLDIKMRDFDLNTRVIRVFDLDNVPDDSNCYGNVMLFSDLIDMDGKLIFQGDIVEIPEYYDTPESTNTNWVRWEVVFKFGAFMLQNKDNPAEIDSTDSIMHREYESYDGRFVVVGNIHENPELIP